MKWQAAIKNNLIALVLEASHLHPFRVGLKGKQTLPFGDCSDGERPYPSPPPLPWVEKRQWYAGKCLTAHWRHLWSVNTPARPISSYQYDVKWLKCFLKIYQSMCVSWVELAQHTLEGGLREPQCLDICLVTSLAL